MTRVDPIARMLAMLEALTEQLFPAIRLGRWLRWNCSVSVENSQLIRVLR